MSLLVVTEGGGLLVVLTGAFASVRALAKARGVEESVSLLTTANDGLRQANSDLEEQRRRDRDEFREQLHQQELECSKQIAELRGQVVALTGALADKIVAAVVAALPKGSA